MDLLAKQGRDTLEKSVAASLVLKAENEGDFEAVFSTFDVVDHDGDIVLAGAIPDGVEVPVVWHHNWAQPVGRGVVTSELGRAIIRGRFFTETAAGMEAYKTVKAMGDLQEYSWGFRIIVASYEQRDNEWVRLIKQVDIYEVSPVLRGAGMHTGTLAIKSQSLSDQFGTAQALVQDLVNRVKSLADLRAKEGRALSEANRQRLATLRDQMAAAMTEVDELLAATEPAKAVSSEAMLAELLKFEAATARTRVLA